VKFVAWRSAQTSAPPETRIQAINGQLMLLPAGLKVVLIWVLVGSWVADANAKKNYHGQARAAGWGKRAGSVTLGGALLQDRANRAPAHNQDDGAREQEQQKLADEVLAAETLAVAKAAEERLAAQEHVAGPDPTFAAATVGVAKDREAASCQQNEHGVCLPDAVGTLDLRQKLQEHKPRAVLDAPRSHSSHVSRMRARGRYLSAALMDMLPNALPPGMCEQSCWTEVSVSV
jgi:hypothetical protein